MYKYLTEWVGSGLRGGAGLCLAAVLVLEGCSAQRCRETARDIDLVSGVMELSHDCGHSTRCDLSRVEATVSLPLDGEPCLRKGQSARINGQLVEVTNAGSHRVPSESHTPGAIDQCYCNIPYAVTVLARDLEEDFTFTFPADDPSIEFRWKAALDFIQVEFHDGHPVPEGGRIVVSFANHYGARVDAIAEVPENLEIGRLLVQDEESQEWVVPSQSGTAAGVYPATITWMARHDDGCKGGSPDCSLTTLLVSHFEISVE